MMKYVTTMTHTQTTRSAPMYLLFFFSFSFLFFLLAVAGYGREERSIRKPTASELNIMNVLCVLCVCRTCNYLSINRYLFTPSQNIVDDLRRCLMMSA
jgi:hypothetical protein